MKSPSSVELGGQSGTGAARDTAGTGQVSNWPGKLEVVRTRGVKVGGVVTQSVFANGGENILCNCFGLLHFT